jgi:uncharacterized protein YndB with AHSA1/START domain
LETITVDRVIAAPINDVFTWLTTTANYTASPMVLRCRLARPGADAPYGLGAVRVHLWLIGWYRERITRYEPPYVTEYAVDRSVPASRHELGRMTFTEVDGGTRVEWTTRAEARIPLVGRLVTRVLGRRVIAGTFRRILQAADAALTQGR